jgi:hypothetical protein
MMGKALITGILSLFIGIVGVHALGEVYLVKPDGTGDFPVIQAAVDGAQDGDEILLADGVYTGLGNNQVRFWGKAITIRSQSGNAVDCIIDGQGSIGIPRTPFLFEHGEGPDTVIRDLTLRNGSTSTVC